MTILDEFHRDEQHVLDRLVDGELGPSQRRELLGALDDEPGAWRRCALAFLESQTWRLQLSRLAAEPLVAQAHTQAMRRFDGPTSHRFLSWCLAVAAGLLVAFGLGTRFPSTIQSPPGAESETLVDLGTENPEEPGELASAEPEEEETPWETLTLASEDGSDPENNIQLRVVNSGESDPTWSASAQSAVSSRLLRELEDAGWEVKRERRLVPVELTDGRRIVVPVEEVDLRYPEMAQF